jgi:hypothetical protein
MEKVVGAEAAALRRCAYGIYAWSLAAAALLVLIVFLISGAS